MVSTSPEKVLQMRIDALEKARERLQTELDDARAQLQVIFLKREHHFAEPIPMPVPTVEPVKLRPVSPGTIARPGRW